MAEQMDGPSPCLSHCHCAATHRGQKFDYDHAIELLQLKPVLSRGREEQ